jgi:hypothetical protein
VFRSAAPLGGAGFFHTRGKLQRAGEDFFPGGLKKAGSIPIFRRQYFHTNSISTLALSILFC